VKKTKLLFICSGNFDRSPTAADIFKNSRVYEAKSAGTHANAEVKVSQELLDWADMIFVMSERDDKHLSFLKSNFHITGKQVYDLGIPDEYSRSDPKLISLLRAKLKNYIILDI